MTAKKNQSNTVTTSDQAPKSRVVHYLRAKFKPTFSTQLGNVSGGTIYGYTDKQESRHSISWIPGSPMVFVKWRSETDGIKAFDIPLMEIESLERIPAGDSPIELE